MLKQLKISREQIELGLTYFFIFSLFIDIGGRFGIKYISFAIMMLYCIYSLYKDVSFFNFNKYLIEVSVFVIIPTVLVLLSVYRGIRIMDIFSQASYLLTFFAFPLILRLSRKQITSILLFVTKLGCILIFLTFSVLGLLILFKDFDTIHKINSFSNQFSLGYIGLRQLGSGSMFPNVYFRWTLLLIPGIVIWSKTENRLTFFGIAAVFLTLSTGAILFTIIGVLMASPKISRIKLNKYQIWSAGLVTCLLFFLLLKMPIFNDIFSKFSFSSESTSTKLLHIQSIFNALSGSPFNLLFGMGIGSDFYSLGVNAFVINVEVSHFNMIRQFGLIYSSVFFAYIFFVYSKLRLTDTVGYGLGVGLIMIFFAAGTNPLLLSPVFLLILIISRAYLEI